GVTDGRRQFQPPQTAEEVAVGVLGAQPRKLPARLLHLAADTESRRLEQRLANVDANGGDRRLAERLEADAHSRERAQVVDALLGELQGARLEEVAPIDPGRVDDLVGRNATVPAHDHPPEPVPLSGLGLAGDAGALVLA